MMPESLAKARVQPNSCHGLKTRGYEKHRLDQIWIMDRTMVESSHFLNLIETRATPAPFGFGLQIFFAAFGLTSGRGNGLKDCFQFLFQGLLQLFVLFFVLLLLFAHVLSN